MGPLPRPASSSAGSWSSTARILTRPSCGLARCPTHNAEPSSCARSGTARPEGAAMQPLAEPTAQTIEQVFRQEYGRILATLIRVFGDFDVAEDALQEAFIAAVEHWPIGGIPDNAAAWLTTTARNKGVSRL